MRFVVVVAVKSICLCSPCNWHLVLGEKQRERERERFCRDTVRRVLCCLGECLFTFIAMHMGQRLWLCWVELEPNLITRASFYGTSIFNKIRLLREKISMNFSYPSLCLLCCGGPSWVGCQCEKWWFLLVDCIRVVSR